jgi:hypothetical protein
MLILFVASCATAAVLAWLIATRHPEHRATAALLSTLLGLQMAVLALDSALLGPLRAELGVHAPWTGWAWAASLLTNALELAWPAAILGTAIVVFARKKPWPAVVAWAAAVVAYAALHPIAGDNSQPHFRATADMLGALSAALLGISWYRRRADAARPAHHVLGMIIVMELLALPETPRVGALQNWPAPPIVYVVVLAVIALMHVYSILQRVAVVERGQDAQDAHNATDEGP